MMTKMKKETFKDILTYGRCGHCDNPGKPEHQCPYAIDIFNNPEKMCNCCDDCTQACMDDI